tara:strand:+ start:2501 stop:3322 length:822 start_codon:yes stop_codon:yes gene_type:complete
MSFLEELFSLDKKVIIVFGGGGQIGFELSKACVQAGAQVIIADYDISQVEKKISETKFSSLAKEIDYFKIDVTNESEVSNVFEKIFKKYNKICGIINSFHFKGDSRKLDLESSFFQDFEDYSLKVWNKVHDVNLTGVFLTSRESVKYFKKSNSGVIINISSTYGNVSPNKNIYKKNGINSPPSYASSKSAIINFTRYLATHLAEYNIRANVLSPGGVLNNQDEEFIREYENLTPLKRMALSDDYTGAVIYMLSDSSKYMTGSNIIIDGGWTAW